MQIGLLQSRQKLTGRLYFARTGNPLVDLGNVELVKQNNKLTRGQMKHHGAGLARVIHEELGEVDWRWQVKLSEYAGPGLQLLYLASAQTGGFTNSIQIGQADETFELAYLPGVPFFIGVGMTNLVFSTAANGGGTVHALTWGTQYTYNADTGYLTVFSTVWAANGGPFGYGVPIYVTYTVLQPQVAITNTIKVILSGGQQLLPGQSTWVGYCGLTAFTELLCNTTNYTAGTDYTIDFNSGMLTAINTIGLGGIYGVTAFITAPNLAFFDYTVLSNTFARGNAQLNLYDQNNEEDPLPTTAPREIAILPSAEINTSEWPQDDGAKWAGWTVELLALTPPTIQDRQ
jgi:hypothetical protein